MGYIYAELGDLVREVDRVRKFLSRIKVRQVRNAEHRDLLKATALSLFHTRRPSVVAALSQDVLNKLDESYRIILDASERDSVKNTFATAAKHAHDALMWHD